MCSFVPGDDAVHHMMFRGREKSTGFSEWKDYSPWWIQMARIVKQPAHHSSVWMCVNTQLCTSNSQFASLFSTQKSQSALLYIFFLFIMQPGNECWCKHIQQTACLSHWEMNKATAPIHWRFWAWLFLQEADKMTKGVNSKTVGALTFPCCGATVFLV